MQKHAAEYESFTIISFDLFLIYGNKYNLQVHLDNCAYKIVDKLMTNYLDENLFETDFGYFFDKLVLYVLYYDKIDLGWRNWSC